LISEVYQCIYTYYEHLVISSNQSKEVTISMLIIKKQIEKLCNMA